MHWGLALLVSLLTCTLFVWVRLVVQASFAKEIDRDTDAERLAYAGIVLQALVFPILIIAGLLANDPGSSNNEVMGFLGIVCIFLMFGAQVCLLSSSFSIRESLVGYYKGVESTDLRLSGPMTFFFHTFYLQYHLTRIAEWKQTGTVYPV